MSSKSANEVETEIDIQKIEEMQLLSAQSSNFVRQISESDLSLSTTVGNQTHINNSLLEKEKVIQRLEHKLNIVTESKRRIFQHSRKRPSRQINTNIRDFDSKKSYGSTRAVIPEPLSSEKFISPFKCDPTPSQLDQGSVEEMEQESDPEP